MSQVAEFIPKQPSLVGKIANKYGVDPEKMMVTLRSTAFRGDVTNEQMMALLIVSDQYNLNPWLKQIYAYPDKGGIVPVVSVDGWARIINEHPQFDGLDFEMDADANWCSCAIHRKDRSHPTKVTEYMAEVRKNTAPWNSHPRRMLRHKALIQCARIAFGFSGIFDEDEAERIIESDINPVQEKQRKLAQAVVALQSSIAVIKEGIETGNLSQAAEAWFELSQEEQESIWVAPTANVNGKRVPVEGAPFTTREREIIKSPEFRQAHFGVTEGSSN